MTQDALKENSSSAGAKTYYSTADYYTEGQELAGIWRGKAAERLGLSGTVQQADWDALCDNRFPGTGAPLTLRRKAERRVDPHLHAHCFVFNTTWDPTEGVWKAGQFGDLKRDAPYFEAKFHVRLAERLRELGLDIERTRTGWELAGISKSANEKFSRRTALIEEEARRLGLEDASAKSDLGAKTRERKQKELSLQQLAEEWRGRLSADELDSISAAQRSVGGPAQREDVEAAPAAVARAVEHVFERKSVAAEREVLTHALKLSVGSSSVASVENSWQRAEVVRADRQGRRMVTTPTVIREERSMIRFAREGRGTRSRLGTAGTAIQRDWLNADQRKAVEHVWASRDLVTLVRGAAGVGKTTMMQEAVAGIRASGLDVLTLAPSATARDVLKQEGFDEAETVARLLVDKTLQEEIQGQVLWIDEAGRLGSRTMAQVFELAGKHDCRVVLSGDRRQHGSVERGAALRLLEEEAGLKPAEIREIQRQKGDYKQAVQALADGRTEEGFRQLSQLGWVREVEASERYQVMAADYVAAVSKGQSTLVVSPTHLEGERITQAIRERLRQAELIKPDERGFAVLENANLTQAERGDAVNLVPGDVLVFHQNAKGFTKGQRVIVGQQQIPTDQAARFQVFHPSEIQLAPGDVIRVTQNGKTLDEKHRLNNGDLHRVRDFDEIGNIVLGNGWTVSKDYGHLAYGYCVTSHASQGKSVDRVLIGQSSQSFAASSKEQFYVSVSRGKREATIYTDNREDLLRAVQKSDDRLTATELLEPKEWREKGAQLRRQEMQAPSNRRPPLANREREMAHDR